MIDNWNECRISLEKVRVRKWWHFWKWPHVARQTWKLRHCRPSHTTTDFLWEWTAERVASEYGIYRANPSQIPTGTGEYPTVIPDWLAKRI